MAKLTLIILMYATDRLL